MNYDKIVEGYLELKDSAFWALYNTELTRYQSSRLEKLKTDPIDKILSIQGEVKSLEWVARLPERILAELVEKNKKGE